MNIRYYGFWGSGEVGDDLPVLEDNIDPSWQPSDRELLIEYLLHCPIAIASSALRSPCALCGKLVNYSSYQSDNVWLWPADLTHLIINHSVRIPDSLCDHIRNNKYAYPRSITVGIDQLPWPP